MSWMAPPIPGSRLWGWLLPLAVTVLAGWLRFDRLGKPHAVVFDETYYAKDSLALWKFGYEHNTLTNADKILLAPGTNTRNPHIWADGGSFIAHPPAGKWIIGFGEWIFGATPFGWRFMPALFGTLSVLILARIARRMTGSTLLGCVAGLLLALDGLELVVSRTAVLDVFVMFWVICAFGCLVIDRDVSRARLALLVEERGPAGVAGGGPFVMHWWRVACGVCLGLCCATKWDGIYFVAAFGLMVVFWDWGARRTAGIERPLMGALRLEAVPAFLSLVVVSVVVYVVSWSGWIFTTGGWGRGKAASHWYLRPFEALPKLWDYNHQIWNFHVGLHEKHPYQSWPWQWPILQRPVAFYYTEPAGPNCGSTRCSREVLCIGTPAIWWVAIVALVMLIFIWAVNRDWRAGAILLSYLAGWVPWFVPAFNDRTMFQFYATTMLPFMVLGITLVIGLLIGPERIVGVRRVFGSALAGAYLLVVLANFVYLYPILTAKIIPYLSWHSRMWFDSWI
jgi:dolichyl-phosphate-mannose--protein O-mannosyl transferase